MQILCQKLENLQSRKNTIRLFFFVDNADTECRMMEKKERKKMTYFAQVVDHWDCELDFIGPFDSEEKAENAAWAKWDGDDNVYKVYVVKKAPVFFS